MHELRRNTMVGLFMIVGLAALAWLMTSFGELPTFMGGATYEIKIVVKELKGIGQGAAINLSGVQIGRVKEVRFKDPEHLDAGVQIIGAIDQHYRIPNTATAIVQPAGLGFGRGSLTLDVVEGEQAPPLVAGEEIVGIMGGYFEGIIPDTLLVTLESTIARFGTLLEELTPVANDMHNLLQKSTVQDVDRPAHDARRITANLYTVVQRFDSTLKNFNETFGDPTVREGLLDMIDNVRQMSVDGRASLDNIRTTTADLRESLARISEKLEAGIDNANRRIDNVADDLRPVLLHSASLAASLNHIARTIEQGRGTAGLFVNDPRLYESLLLTSQRLTEMVDTIQRLAAKFELDGEIRLDVPVGPFRHNARLPIPDSSGRPSQ